MKKTLFAVVLLLLASTFSFGQTKAYKDLLKSTAENGWKFYTDKEFFLKQGENGSINITLPGNRQYKIFAVCEYSEVTDVDCWAYNEEGELIVKDTEVHRMAIVNITRETEGKVKIVMKNIKSTIPNDATESRILITYRNL